MTKPRRAPSGCRPAATRPRRCSQARRRCGSRWASGCSATQSGSRSASSQLRGAWLQAAPVGHAAAALVVVPATPVSHRRSPARGGAPGAVTSAPSGLRPVCSATSSSSSVSRLARPLIASATGSGRCAQSASGPSGRRPSTRTGCPGLPTTVASAGTSWMTTELAPILERAPTAIGPSSLAPEPIITWSPTVGWRLPRAKPVPPSVTPWYIVTSSPTSAVSPITTPAPWSMNSPRPMRAAGWISTPVTTFMRLASMPGSSGTRASCRACETRCASSAWTPP